MRLVRVSWLILIAVIIIVAAVPALREQARVVPAFILRGLWPVEDFVWLRQGVQQAARFVDRYYPNDPDMLQAVGTMALMAEPDPWSTEEGLASGEPAWIARTFLQRAAEADGTPAAWAAYVELLLLKTCHQIGPEHPSRLAPTPGRPPESGTEPIPEPLPRVPDPQIKAEILAAVQDWQSVDPKNGFPVALQAGQLRGAEAQSLWLAASTMPLVSDRCAERLDALSLLLQRMGFPEMEAREAADFTALGGSWISPTMLTISAMAFSDEGVRAASEGRGSEAVRLWQASIDLGRMLQASADTLGQLQDGWSIERIGAEPVWQLHPKQHVGMTDEERHHRSFWHGNHYALYVDQAGEQADGALRDRLVINRVRSDLLEVFVVQTDTMIYVHTFVLLALAAGLLVLLFCIVSLCGREAADSARTIGPGWRAALILAALLLGGFFFLLWAPGPTCLWMEPGGLPPSVTIWAAAATIPLAVLLLSLLSVIYRHPGPASTWTVWRGNIRAILPATAVLVALTCVAVGLHAAPSRAKATSELRRSEVMRAIEQLGDSWTNPTIPPDAYRAQYPPNISP
jgi:hypothetical protein